MKKVTNLFAWITLAIVLMVGTTVIKADGIIVHHIAESGDGEPCQEGNSFFEEIEGIIVTVAPSLTGIIVHHDDDTCDTGVMISD